MMFEPHRSRSRSIYSSRGSERQTKVLQPRSASFVGSLPVEGFSLNRLDFSSLGLYGREKEISQLWDVYNKVKSTGTKGLVMLSGYTGTGKSAIVKKFQKQVQREYGSKSFFATGKFDLLHRAEPYTALISAFTELGDNLLDIKNDDVDDFVQIRNSILVAVGSEGGILSSIMPNIDDILGKEAMESLCANQYDESTRARNRFNYVLRQFVRAVGNRGQPLTVFLDDLQWADEASLDVVDILLNDSQLAGLLLVGCYRENEVNDSHPLSILLRSLQMDRNPQDAEVELSVSSIQVGNLDVETVHKLTTDVLNMSDKSQTLALATNVHRKTHGNVFFVIQFLMTLLDKGILEYSLATQTWTWDDKEIRENTRVADNVVELLQTKLRSRVARPAMKVLLLASCLGATFDKSTLVHVVENLWQDDNELWSDTALAQGQSDAPAEEHLISCVDDGFFEESSTTLSFAHDQIQAAAFSLIPDDRKSLFQLRIGEVLLETLPEDNKKMFVAVDLINNGYDQIKTDSEKQVAFARLNLQAGKKSIAALAFTAASTYLATGIEILGPNRWETQYELSLHLTNLAMNAEYCRGNFEQVHQYADEIIEQTDRPIQDKITAHGFRMECVFDQGRPVEALKMCLELLAQLGEQFNLKFGKASIFWELLKTRKFMKKQSMDSLCDLPYMEDKMKLQAMKLMLKAGTFALAGNPELFPLLVFKGVRIAVRYGVSKYSPPVFAGYGMMVGTVFGDFKEADVFGKLALSLLHRIECTETKAVTLLTYNSCISHWVRPLQLCRKESLKSYEIGMQTGDPLRAMVSISQFCTMCFVTGEPLSKLEADLREYCRQMEEYKQELTLDVARITRQSVLNLLSRPGDHDTLTKLSGEAMKQDELEKHCAESGRVQLLNVMKVFQLQLAFLFDHYGLASKLVGETQNVAKTNPANIVVWMHAGFEGLACFALARKGVKRRRWRSHAVKVLRKIRKWVSDGQVNCLHTLYLLEAEMYALDGKVEEAKKRYDSAIATAGRAGFRVDKAISYERAGEFYLTNLGDVQWASYYLSLAHKQYSEWEAWTKVDYLSRKHGALILESTTQVFSNELQEGRNMK